MSELSNVDLLQQSRQRLIQSLLSDDGPQSSEDLETATRLTIEALDGDAEDAVRVMFEVYFKLQAELERRTGPWD